MINPQPKNELATELLSIHALNAFAQYNSSSRSTMFASHICQRLVIEGAEESIIQTGVEREFGKYTFNIKMPEDGKIIKVIDRYPKGVDYNSLKFNPETIVIYEKESNKEIDYFSIPYHASFHQFFGFKYDIKPEAYKIKPGAYISKGTIFADTPSVAENSGFKYGINANVAFMSLPSVSEDGFMVSRAFVNKLKFKIYETRTVSFGSSNFPLNLYGTREDPKPFPDIGENIRDDGVLMMLRSYDDDLMPIEISALDIMEPDFIFDKGIYVRGGKGKVVDIKVISNNNTNKLLPEGMCAHIEKYEKALTKFHNEIIATEENIRRERRLKYQTNSVSLSPKFHRLMVESLANVNHNSEKLKPNLNLLYRKDPVDEYMIEFVIEYTITPDIGFKLTDRNGGKGVICEIVEDENDMPVDAEGNRADIVMDGASIINRMNIGRIYEHYFTSACRDTTKKVRNILGVQETNIDINRLNNIDTAIINQAYTFLLGFYNLISVRQYEFFNGQITDEEKLEHLVNVVNKGIYLYYPIENQIDIIETIQIIESSAYKPLYGPVTFLGNSGERVTTVDNVRIAPLYVMLLEKIADDWSSVSSGKLQHFGILSPITKAEKFSYPYRNSPVRTIGETEGRIFASYCGREAIAEMMDRSNNPMTQRNVVWNILQSDKPTNIDSVVDRNYVTLGGSKPVQLIKHMFECAGFIPYYEPEDK